ncbi:MAG: hypothetical protein ACUVQY_03560 [Thermoproteota archaeon]
MGNLAKKFGVFLNRVLELLPKGRGAIKECTLEVLEEAGVYIQI